MEEFSSAWEEAASEEAQKAALDTSFERGEYRGIARSFAPAKQVSEKSPYHGHEGEVVTLHLELVIPGKDKPVTKLVDVAAVPREQNGRVSMAYATFSKLAKALGMYGKPPKSVLMAASEKALLYKFSKTEKQDDGVGTGEYVNYLNGIRAEV